MCRYGILKEKMTKVVDMVFMRVYAFLRSQNSFMRTCWLVERFQRAEVEGEGNQAAVLHGPEEDPFLEAWLSAA